MKKVITVLCVALMFGAVTAQDGEWVLPDVTELSRVRDIEGEREFQKTENFLGAQKRDGRPIVAVGLFTSTVESPFEKQISSKVEEVLKKTNRFQMPDRLHYESVQAELEFQKHQIDSDNLVQQGAALGADYIVSGHINKLTVFRTTSGFSASVGFTVKVANVATGEITNETSFSTPRGRVVLSAESAINEILKTVEPELLEWTARDFPTTIAKIGTTKKGKARTVYIVGGESFGYRPKDNFLVTVEEEFGGQKMQKNIGTIRLIQSTGGFSEARVRKGGDLILQNLQANKTMKCHLQRK